ncbi:MAG TPA: VOC family protein [bacterium]
MRIPFASVLVKDQEQALRFYTEKLGFTKKRDIPMGGPRWLTVVSPAAPDGVELVLEPMGYPFAVTWQRELYAAGVPATAFQVDDIQAEYQRLSALGVTFAAPPKAMGPTIGAKLDDTCGNWIQIFQLAK